MILYSLNRSRDITPEAVIGRSLYSNVFRYNFRSEVDDDVVSDVAVDNAGMDVYVTFGDSRSYSLRDIRLGFDI